MKRVGDLVPPFESCGVCSPDGWVVKWTRYDMDGSKLVRCKCWRAHQQRILDTVQATAKKGKR